MPLTDRLRPEGPKKLLALDGGGIRGLITIEVLSAVEDALRKRLRRGESLVLADYFDYVAGTSTGAIIAACIALGMSVATIRQFYKDNGKTMFDKASLIKRFRYKYEDDRLAAMLQEVFGADTTLGSDKLTTLRMVVMRNVRAYQGVPSLFFWSFGSDWSVGSWIISRPGSLSCGASATRACRAQERSPRLPRA